VKKPVQRRVGDKREGLAVEVAEVALELFHRLPLLVVVVTALRWVCYVCVSHGTDRKKVGGGVVFFFFPRRTGLT